MAATEPQQSGVLFDLPVDEQLQKMQMFVRGYTSHLKDIERALEISISETWDSQCEPITLHLQPVDTHTPLAELINTSVASFNKVMMVFATLCSEMDDLTNTISAKFFAPLALFGVHVNSTGDPPPAGDVEAEVGRMLPLLLDICSFVSRARDVIRNCIFQLSAVYHADEPMFKTFKPVQLTTVFEHFSNLLGGLISLDHLLFHNATLVGAWQQYRRLSKLSKTAPGHYNLDAAALQQLENMLDTIELTILSGSIYSSCIGQSFDVAGLRPLDSNRTFLDVWFESIKLQLQRLLASIGEPTEANQRRGLLALLGLYVFHCRVIQRVGKIESRFFANVLDCCHKLPVVHIGGSCCFLSIEFMVKKFGEQIVSATEVANQRLRFLKAFDDALPQEVGRLHMETCGWMVYMHTEVRNRDDVHKILVVRTKLFVNGIVLAYRVNNLMRTALTTHVSLGVPIGMSVLSCVLRCVEILKAIEACYHSCRATIAGSLPHMLRYIAINLLRTFVGLKQRLEAKLTKKHEQRDVDVLAAVAMVVDLLQGTSTRSRSWFLVLQLALHIIGARPFQGNIHDEVWQLIKKLRVMCSLPEAVRSACDCSLLFWHREYIPAFFQCIYATPALARRLPYVVAGLSDAMPVLALMMHEPSPPSSSSPSAPTTISSAYTAFVLDSLHKEIIERLCEDIETSLRIQVAVDVASLVQNPLKDGVTDLTVLLGLRRLRWVDQIVDIRAHVQHHLDTKFYNHTAVSLHDWETYDKMRNVARQRFGLDLMEVHLPPQTVDQGVDVLEIMRNLHIFVANYTYHINTQVFIERSGNDSKINTISIQHIANSVRTHGTGILNTAVNVSYQFLKRKFGYFSQFLHDPYIMSRLLTEATKFKEERNKDRARQFRYPYAWMEAFTADIRRLHVSERGLSFLDHFRVLLTEIGNTMGYVRSIRSGALNYCSHATKAMPDARASSQFEKGVANLDEQTRLAARNVDATVSNLQHHFNTGAEYFRLLVDVFKDEFRNPDTHSHLRNFVFIVPALITNFTEHMIRGKNELKKKKSNEAFFCDDGFVIGLAYVLRILDQNEVFDALHFFESSFEHFESLKARKQQQAAQKAKSGGEEITDESDDFMWGHAIGGELSAERIVAQQREFEMFFFSLSGAKIFFRYPEPEA